jgi:hypothetical protein
MKPTLRRELIKMMGKLAEIFEGELLLQLPKVVQFYSKRTKDTSDQNMQMALAESIGKCMQCMFVQQGFTGEEEKTKAE